MMNSEAGFTGPTNLGNPTEFTMLEFYWAYADYTDLMDLTEDMLKGLTESVTGASKVARPTSRRRGQESPPPPPSRERWANPRHVHGWASAPGLQFV